MYASLEIVTEFHHNSVKVLFVARDEHQKRWLQSHFRGCDLVTIHVPLVPLHGYRYDVIVYSIPKYREIDQWVKYVEWIMTVCRATLEPEGVEMTYKAQPDIDDQEMIDNLHEWAFCDPHTNRDAKLQVAQLLQGATLEDALVYKEDEKHTEDKNDRIDRLEQRLRVLEDSFLATMLCS